MPLRGFICPDGIRIKREECLLRCRLSERCVSKSTLLAISDGSHDWDGTPHVTQLLNGTREEYLKVKHDYYVSADSMAFALLGSSHHKLLEEYPSSDIISEMKFRVDNLLQGTADVIELNFVPDTDTWTLIDYKTWGSYKAAKALGIVKVAKKEFKQVHSQRDVLDESLQLNMYRVFLEDKLNISISQLRIQCTVRDGNTYMATNRGVFKAIYMIDIPIMQGDVLRAWVAAKSQKLINAVELDIEPDTCSDRERWEDRKCASYCVVKEHCSYGRFVGVSTK